MRIGRPEVDALLACARIDIADDELRSRLGRVTHWQGLRDLALRHAMVPMLYSRVDGCRDIVPPSALEELRSINRANSERCVRLSAALLNILALLDSQSIPVVAYKGPLLSEYAYGDVTMRHFQDLDLFIARSDLANAHRALETRGFRTEPTLPAGRRSNTEAFHHIVQGDGVTVELHWRTGPAYVPPLFAADELLRRARPATLLGRPVLTLDPADLLLALCVHGHAHRWSQLESVAAVARVLDKGDFGDPGLLLQRARTRRCLRRLLIGSLLAKDLAGASLPKAFEAAIAGDRLARCLVTKASSLIAASGRSGDTRVVTTVWRTLSMDRPRDALRLATLQVFAPRAEDMAGAESSRAPRIYARVRRIRRLRRSVRKR